MMSFRYGWRLLLCGALIGCWGSGCRPKVPPIPGAGAGSRLSSQVRTRSCPNELAFSPDTPAQSRFLGGPCKLSDALAACTKRCSPFGGAGQIGDAPDDFFARCEQDGILCVGPNFATKDLKAAVAKVKADEKISRILLAAGRYQGGVTFADVRRTLTIEGSSNDLAEGVIIEAPAWEQGPLPADAAALSFQRVTGVVLRRLVVKGGRHGIAMDGVAQVGIDGVIATHNIGHGLALRAVEKADISRSQFSSNGVASDGRISSTSPCRYGVALEGVQTVVIETSHFLHNGAGGLRAGPSSLVSGEACEQVRLDPGAQVPVSTEWSLSLSSNLFSTNGPLGWSPPGPDDGDCQAVTCGDGAFCERGRCVPQLLAKGSEQTSTAIGVGAVIAGYGKVTLMGNGIHDNDTVGLLIHSATQVQLQQNAISMNGLRRGATDADLTRFATTAVQLWGVLQATVIHNLIIDNVAAGMALSYGADARQRSLELLSNHISGNGRFVELAADQVAAGLVISAPKSDARIVADVSSNYFSANVGAGLRVSGGLLFSMEGNYLEYQLGAGAAFVELGAGKTSVFSLVRNTIKGARVAGLSFRGGASRVLLDANLIKEIRPAKGEPDDGIADGIQLIDLTGDAGVLTNNKVDGEWLESDGKTARQARAGIVLDGSRASLESNGFANVKHRIVVQDGGELISATETQILRPTAPLPLDKP